MFQARQGENEYARVLYARKRPVYISNCDWKNKKLRTESVLQESPRSPPPGLGLDVDGVVEEVVAIVFWWQEVGTRG